MALSRLHLKIRERRTTVLIPRVLVELLALKLGAEPGTPDAHAGVREWLQGEIDRDPGAIPPKGGATQRLVQQVILEIAAPGLIKKHDAWNEKRFGY